MTTEHPAAPRSSEDQAIHDKLNDALTPGYQAEFDPEEAQRAGAFAEDALSEADAAESAIDLDAALGPIADRAIVLEDLPEISTTARKE